MFLLLNSTLYQYNIFKLNEDRFLVDPSKIFRMSLIKKNVHSENCGLDYSYF